MKITLSPDLESYLHHKHKEVIEIYVERVFSSHMMEAPVSHLEIKFGTPKPELQDQFSTFEVDGFKLFIESDLVNDDSDIFLHLEKFLGLKFVEVEGLSQE